jgi:hypothetical protein
MRKLITLFLIAVLAGCGSPISEGEICNREFIPQHETTVTTIESTDPLIFGTDTSTVPDKWFLTFRRKDEKTNTWIKREIEVDEATFNATKIGDWYDTHEKD